MSTAVATGAVLQVYEKWPKLAPGQVKRKILNAARSLDLDPETQGSGIINMEQVFREPGKSNAQREEVKEVADAKFFFGENWWIILLIIFFFWIWGGF
jgi:hypothetical protein